MRRRNGAEEQDGGGAEGPSSILHLPSFRQLGIMLLISVFLCLVTWSLAFYATGDRLECRFGPTSLCALRTRIGSGTSIQWGQQQQPALWQWGPGGCCNRRLWPPEEAK